VRKKADGRAVGCRMNSVLKERRGSIAGNLSGPDVAEVKYSQETLITVRIMIGISGFVCHGVALNSDISRTADQTLGSKVLFQTFSALEGFVTFVFGGLVVSACMKEILRVARMARALWRVKWRRSDTFVVWKRFFC
jgi:hypothetical protein